MTKHFYIYSENWDKLKKTLNFNPLNKFGFEGNPSLFPLLSGL